MKNVLLLSLVTLTFCFTSCAPKQAVVVTPVTAEAPPTAKETEDKKLEEAEAKKAAGEGEKLNKMEQAILDGDLSDVGGEIINRLESRFQLSEAQRAGIRKLAAKYDFENMTTAEQQASARQLRKEVRGLLRN